MIHTTIAKDQICSSNNSINNLELMIRIIWLLERNKIKLEDLRNS